MGKLLLISEMEMPELIDKYHSVPHSTGKTATHAFVMCQLYTPDGECHGLHGFVVPIRDPKTMLPFPGVTIFDMGEKVGKLSSLVCDIVSLKVHRTVNQEPDTGYFFDLG